MTNPCDNIAICCSLRKRVRLRRPYVTQEGLVPKITVCWGIGNRRIRTPQHAVTTQLVSAVLRRTSWRVLPETTQVGDERETTWNVDEVVGDMFFLLTGDEDFFLACEDGTLLLGT